MIYIYIHTVFVTNHDGSHRRAITRRRWELASRGSYLSYFLVPRAKVDQKSLASSAAISINFASRVVKLLTASYVTRYRARNDDRRET